MVLCMWPSHWGVTMGALMGSFLFCFWPHGAVLSLHSWLCAQESFQQAQRILWGLGIKLGQLAVHLSALLYYLLLLWAPF